MASHAIEIAGSAPKLQSQFVAGEREGCVSIGCIPGFQWRPAVPLIGRYFPAVVIGGVPVRRVVVINNVRCVNCYGLPNFEGTLQLRLA